MDQLVLNLLLSHHCQVVPYKVQRRKRVFKVLFVQIDLLRVALFIELRIGFWHLGDEVVQGVSPCAFLLLLILGRLFSVKEVLLLSSMVVVVHFLVRLVHTLVLVDVLRVLARCLALAVRRAVLLLHILKDEVGRDLLPPQRLALVQSAAAVLLVVDGGVERVLKFLAVSPFLHHSLGLLLAPSAIDRHRQEISIASGSLRLLVIRPHLKGPILILLLLLRQGVRERLISRAILHIGGDFGDHLSH